MADEEHPGATTTNVDQSAADLPPSEFALEEYKQVVEERRMVITRYIQAVGFYLALSGFGLKELASISAASLVVGSSILFSALNVLAIYAAINFRSMAQLAADREKFFVERYKVQRASELFWGYTASIWLVILNQVTIIALAAWKLYSGQRVELQLWTSL